MAIFKFGVAAAADSGPIESLTDDSQSATFADAIVGVVPIAPPIPNPRASRPSRAMARVFLIDCSFPQNANWRLYQVGTRRGPSGLSICAAVNSVRTKSDNF